MEPVRTGLFNVTQGKEVEESETQSMPGIFSFDKLTFVVEPGLKVLFVELLGLTYSFKVGLLVLFLDFLDVLLVEGVFFEG